MLVQYIEKYKKNIAIDMRKRGLSYSEIQNRIHIPKSTLSFWLKKIRLNEDQKKKLDNNRLEAIKKGSKKKSLKILKLVEEIKKSSAEDIKKISDRELWLMGVILYWRERLLSGKESDLRKGVKFSSSDPYLIKLFLKWLRDIGRIEEGDIALDVLMDESYKSGRDEAIEYWSEVSGFSRDKFLKVYFYKNKKAAIRSANKSKFGLLRVRVRSSSMLARQIYGWVRGIVRYYWK